MRSFYLLTLFLALFVSCKNENAVENNFIQKDIIGEWIFEPNMSTGYQNKRLVIDSLLNFIEYSYSKGGSIEKEGTLFTKDSLKDLDNNKYALGQPDDDTLCITKVSESFLFSYRQQIYSRYDSKINTEDIRRWKENDSLRSLALGWWDSLEAKDSIKVPNYSQKIKKFALHIKPDGEALVYREMFLDSIIRYGYLISDDHIDFRKLDVIISVPLFFESDSIMIIALGNRWRRDTLRLKKRIKL